MAYDSSKPVTGGSLVAADMRENFRALKEDDIVEGVAATGIVEGMLANSAVAQAKLKTSQHSQSTTSTNWHAKVLTYAEYGFECTFDHSGSGESYFKRADGYNHPVIVSGGEKSGESVYLKSTAGTAYVKYRYVTSSGEVFWIWLLRDKITKKIISGDASSDHCSFGLLDPSMRPHPFEREYDPAKHEIVLITPSSEELKELYSRKNGRGPLQTFLEDYEVDERSEKPWPSKKVTVGIKNDDWFEHWITGKKVEIIKKQIPKPDYVLVKGLKIK